MRKERISDEILQLSFYNYRDNVSLHRYEDATYLKMYNNIIMDKDYYIYDIKNALFKSIHNNLYNKSMYYNISSNVL